MIFQFSNFVQVWHFNGIWIDWIDECFRGHLVAGEMKQLTDFWWNFIAARFATGNGCDHVDGATPATRLVRDRILIGFLVYFQVICIRSMGPRWIVFSAPPPVCYLCLFVRQAAWVACRGTSGNEGVASIENWILARVTEDPDQGRRWQIDWWSVSIARGPPAGPDGTTQWTRPLARVPPSYFYRLLFAGLQTSTLVRDGTVIIVTIGHAVWKGRKADTRIFQFFWNWPMIRPEYVLKGILDLDTLI